MNNVNKVTVKIQGAEYPMVGDKPAHEMIKVANYVDQEMTKVIESNPKLSTVMAGIVTAINITDQLFECDDYSSDLAKENDELRRKVDQTDEGLKLEIKKLQLQLDSRDKEISEAKSKIDELNKLLEEKSKELESKEAEINNLSMSTVGSKSEVESYKSEIDDLEELLKAAEERAKIAESLSSEFQNKAYKIQLKYTELENEVKYLRATR
ncbi:MAG: cell division protein ZapA [Peptostreptococcaceae bacterium]|nr:cell division protein ZapA [Peptostreptococcaceae bacterium]MDU4933751.1 cell division protein ZapA [Peptostreptococcaceae bacterium]